MVCDRCVRVVKETLEQMGLSVSQVKLGEVVLNEEEETINRTEIAAALKDNGFELLDDRKAQLIEKIKNIVIETIHQQEEVALHVNYSYLFQTRLGVDYPYLSNLFSSTEGITIEKYIILQRIERVKELLVYNELTLSEIAYKVGYSSVAHLSAQFKKVTGLTPSAFKKLTGDRRKPLDEIGSDSRSQRFNKT